MEPENQTPLDEIPQPPQLATSRKRSRKRTITIFVVVSLINVALLGLLWSQLLTPAPGSSNGQTNIADPLVGQAAPGFRLAALGQYSGLGSTIALDNFKGKPLVLNVWSSSCVPCQREAGIFQTQWQQEQAHGIVFLGIDFEDIQSDGLSFLQKYTITYPNVLDADGSISIAYGVAGTPETIFINRQGVVVARIRGELTNQRLQSNLQLISQ